VEFHQTATQSNYRKTSSNGYPAGTTFSNYRSFNQTAAPIKPRGTSTRAITGTSSNGYLEQLQELPIAIMVTSTTVIRETSSIGT